MVRYFRKLENKYLVSGPAPLGRILNYIKRVKLRQYRTSIRGPRVRDRLNLDDWTVCFMVGIGLLEKPIYSPTLKLRLTKNGAKIYNLIKILPNFPDNLFRAKFDMIRIKFNLKSQNPDIYNSLREIFLKSDAMKNLAIFLQIKGKNKIKKSEFKEFGKIFGVRKAWFNRVPSVLQIAQFCDILEENGRFIRLYDNNYIRDFTIASSEEAARNIVKEDLKEIKEKERKPKELDEDEENFLRDIPTNLVPQKRKVVVNLVKRNLRIAKKLKRLYGGKCQICKFTFRKRNGRKYSETHHLIPLGDSGSDSIANITILCANCHRQLTYAKVELGKLRANKRVIKINDVPKEIEYHQTHLRAIGESDIRV